MTSESTSGSHSLDFGSHVVSLSHVFLSRPSSKHEALANGEPSSVTIAYTKRLVLAGYQSCVNYLFNS